MNFGNFKFDAETFRNVAANASKHMEKAAKKIETAAHQFAESDIGRQLKETVDQVREEYNATFSDMHSIFKAVDERIYVMDFPDSLKAERLATKLNEDWPKAHLVLNMSERTYDTSLFSGEIVDVRFRGLPAPPLDLLISLACSARQWLASNSDHIVVAHCFKGYTRSAVFLSCYLTQTSKAFTDTSDALNAVCKKLKIRTSSIVASQWRYLDYFNRILWAEDIVPQALKITRVTLHGITDFSPCYCEVWHKGELLYSVDDDAKEERDIDSIVFDFRETFDGGGISDDLLVRIRTHGETITICRFAFHCSFVEGDFMHLSLSELDGATNMNPDSFVEIMFDKCDLDPQEAENLLTTFSRAHKARSSLKEIDSDRKFEIELEALQTIIGKPTRPHHSLEEMFDDYEDSFEHGSEPDADDALRVSIGTPIRSSPAGDKNAAQGLLPASGSSSSLTSIPPQLLPSAPGMSVASSSSSAIPATKPPPPPVSNTAADGIPTMACPVAPLPTMFASNFTSPERDSTGTVASPGRLPPPPTMFASNFTSPDEKIGSPEEAPFTSEQNFVSPEKAQPVPPPAVSPEKAQPVPPSPVPPPPPPAEKPATVVTAELDDLDDFFDSLDAES